ncbi:MAG: hypothetical protein PHH59_13985 [Methylovulum sp.]|uniref:hypothetical protein n=1 Tax=Methylovulum sp. TaxID=1916980 RepID=UPI00260A6855|nr:hypothetical protein [Methylovulum sp.]MDD2725115.1 hypothetical protein [Methylovulum sp.]MDD5125847.1 hypothetical protein [Methylovulum sp.]
MDDPCEIVGHTKIVFKDEEHRECKSQFIMENEGKREIRKCKIDGKNSIFENDVLANGVLFKKCDWLAIDVETKLEIYIELKSTYDVKAGVNQIKNTIDKLSEKKELQELRDNKSKFLKIGYIIHSSRIPKLEVKHQTLIEEAKRTHRLKLRFRKTPHTEEITDVIK